MADCVLRRALASEGLPSATRAPSLLDSRNPRLKPTAEGGQRASNGLAESIRSSLNAPELSSTWLHALGSFLRMRSVSGRRSTMALQPITAKRQAVSRPNRLSSSRQERSSTCTSIASRLSAAAVIFKTVCRPFR